MFTAAIKKEFTLVFRDLHSLLVLFAMPVMFIIIMSLAMQEQFSNDNEHALNIQIYNKDLNPDARDFINNLTQSPGFSFKELQQPLDHSDRAQLDNHTRAYIVIPKNFFPATNSENEKNISSNSPALTLWLSPKVDTRTRLLIENAIKQQLHRSKLQFWLSSNGINNDDDKNSLFSIPDINVNYIGTKSNPEGKIPVLQAKKPSSVQQSVPAWLIFSMFFVAIPISTTLITERRQGTLARLKSMSVPMSRFLLAKLLPYLVINQIQLILMLAVGAFLVPILGGDPLEIPTSIPTLIALFLMSLTTGLAAVGYALVIAVIAKTTEQATALGGVGNILLGAIGGIMVPKFVMPEYLQDITLISPMSWSLDGFLNIFLYQAGPTDILNDAAGLLGIGLSLLCLAILLFKFRL